MTSLIWIGVFIISLAALVKGADFLLGSAERIGKYFKLPAFVIGALIVGIGTSLPELASSIAAVFSGEAEIVAANAVGSNIANILLVAGLSAIVGRQIVSTKNLVNIEISLLMLSTVLFLGVAYDGIITQIEALLVAAAFVVYFSYLLFHREDEEIQAEGEPVDKITFRDYAFLVLGSALLGVGATYLIESVIALSVLFDISPGVISISAIALGTSLPEILESVKAVMRGQTDLAFGNVFGSNVFNMLMIVGTIGIFTPLPVDEKTLLIGLPMLAVATLTFIIATLSMRIYMWEGFMFLVLYLFFMLKIFGLI
jgi:cation:H+ antiporter